MGLIGKLAKLGIATKVIDEARKPQNQAKFKRLVSNMANKASRRTQPAR